MTTQNKLQRNKVWMLSVAPVAVLCAALLGFGTQAAFAQQPAPPEKPQILGATNAPGPVLAPPPSLAPALPSSAAPGHVPTPPSDLPHPATAPAPDQTALAAPGHDAQPQTAPKAVSAKAPAPSAPVTNNPQDASAQPAMPSPDEATAQQPAPADMMQAVSGSSTTHKVTPDSKPNEQPDVYYDSRIDTPTGPLANSVGPRKVNPLKEPASKFVVARKNHGANSLESLLVAANRALALDRNAAALDMFNQLYKENPRDPRILMGRAVAQQKMGHADRAIMSYQALLDIDKDNTDALVNMMGLLRKEYPAVAIRRLSDLQATHPGNAGIAAQLGMTYAQTGDDQAAIRELGRAASLDPDNAQHIYNMAVIYDRAGDKAKAMHYYEQALETDAIYGASRSIPRAKVYDRLAELR